MYSKSDVDATIYLKEKYEKSNDRFYSKENKIMIKKFKLQMDLKEFV